jgi:predicted negative regulator of RcsB-dependent stress response
LPRFAYGRQMFIGLIIGLLALSGFFGYRWYQQHRNRAAQYDFGILLDAYTKEQENEKPDFAPIAQQAQAGLQKHKRSALAPLFVVLQADALVAAGKKDEAVHVMADYESQVSHSVFAPLFLTKCAVMRVDSADEGERQKGIEQLQRLAHDMHNVFRDDALYHLFMYYWTQGDVAQARLIGQTLVDAYGHDMQAPSPWLAPVAERLDTLGA